MKNRNFLLIIYIALAFSILSCSYESGNDTNYSLTGDGAGTGGSMARFAITNNHLYTVDQENLKIFDIASSESPEFKNNKHVGFGVETIFPLGNKLFLGSSAGMYIYDVSNPASLIQASFYEHVFACDPVVSDGDYAYVTLNTTAQACWRSVNELQIIDIRNIYNPGLLKQYQMYRPRGLAVRNDTLWVCDNGIKIYDVADKLNINELYHFYDLKAYDIILDEDRAIGIGETGFVQYKLESDSIYKLSEIKVGF